MNVYFNVNAHAHTHTCTYTYTYPHAYTHIPPQHLPPPTPPTPPLGGWGVGAGPKALGRQHSSRGGTTKRVLFPKKNGDHVN